MKAYISPIVMGILISVLLLYLVLIHKKVPGS